MNYEKEKFIKNASVIALFIGCFVGWAVFFAGVYRLSYTTPTKALSTQLSQPAVRHQQTLSELKKVRLALNRLARKCEQEKSNDR